MNELKSCPFCGGEAFTVCGAHDWWHVECHDCCTRSGKYGTREYAIMAWNTRAERTCKNTQSDFDFMCSECSKCVDNGRVLGINYCPRCGAKVVE